MAKNYSKYSAERRAIAQQVRRLEARGYKVPERYHLPTVAELKKMSPTDQNNIMRRAKGYTTAKVRSSARLPVTETTKTGKIKAKTVSYEKGRQVERKRAAEKGLRTRRATKKAREEYGLPKGYVVDADTGEVRKTRRKTDRGTSYVPFTESELENEQPTKEVHYERRTAIDDDGNVYDVKTGEILQKFGKREVEAPTGAKRAGEFDELIDQEQHRIFEEMQDEGRVPDGMTFEEYKGRQAEQPSGSAYVDQMEAYLDVNGDQKSGDLLREIYNRYYGADPEEFEERMSGEDLPDLGDFYYEDSRGNVHYNVNEYIKLLERMKGGPLSARESRKLSDALKNG